MKQLLAALLRRDERRSAATVGTPPSPARVPERASAPAPEPAPARAPADAAGPPSRLRTAVPAWALRALVVCAAVLGLAATAWLVLRLLLQVPLLTVAAAVAALLAALLEPLVRWLRDRGLPAAPAALLSVLLLIGVLTGVGFLIGFRAAGTLRDLARPLAAGIDRIRVWLVDGPLQLEPQRVTEMRNAVVGSIYQLTPEPVAAARTALLLLGAVLLVAFLLFFLLKDGASMWAWLLRRVPERRRRQVDGAGRCAWAAVSQYVRGIVVVALIDAVGIGLALLVLGVPLWVSLTILTFIGAFVPLFGATITGVVAVLVTLVTNGVTDALVVLVVVLVVQQLEGNVLHPVIVGRALHLHPVAILVAVTAGTLLWGLTGALLAVPSVAACYQAVEYLRTHPLPPPAPSRQAVPAADGGSAGAPVPGPGTGTP